MKNIKIIRPLLFVTALIFLTQFSLAQNAQTKPPLKSEATENLIANRSFVFEANTMIPASGRTKQLTTSYSIIINNDSIVSDLPYFGRAYSAPIGTADVGLSFTSTNFEYTVSQNKKSGWDISIKLKDQQDVKQLWFTVFDNGTATLNVNSNNREAISFTGFIKDIR